MLFLFVKLEEDEDSQPVDGTVDSPCYFIYSIV